MSDGQKRTITIREIEDKFWTPPGSDKDWYTAVIEEYPSEPVKIVVPKGNPAPAAGEKYDCMAFQTEKGLRFYPNKNQAPTGNAVTNATQPQSNGLSYGDGQAWGNAVTNATQLVLHFSPADTKLADSAQLVLATAQVLVERNTGPETPMQSGYAKAKAAAAALPRPSMALDDIIDDPGTTPINLDDIPF